MPSNRSSNRPLHQKVRGNKCSRCLQTEVATELCEVSLKEHMFSNVLHLQSFAAALKNESSLFLCSMIENKSISRMPRKSRD